MLASQAQRQLHGLMWKTTPITLIFLAAMMSCLDPLGVLSFGWNFGNTPMIFGSAILGFLLQWSGALALGWPKGHATKLTSFQESNSEIQTSCSDIAKSTMDITKIQKEEAKIVAWESQQKAKAEATIRKLEMKLEKKRSSSMDKILNKLRRAQMKAEKMRSSIAMPQKQEQGQQGKQNSKPLKVFSLPNYIQLWSPSRCFSTFDH